MGDFMPTCPTIKLTKLDGKKTYLAVALMCIASVFFFYIGKEDVAIQTFTMALGFAGVRSAISGLLKE